MSVREDIIRALADKPWRCGEDELSAGDVNDLIRLLGKVDYVIVPRGPTEAMKQAGADLFPFRNAAAAVATWRAMIDALLAE